jgi:Kelch motif
MLHLHKVSACLSALFTVSLAHGRFRGRVMDIKLPKGLSDMTATANPSDGLIYIAGGCDSENGNEYNMATTYFDCSSITNTFYSFNPNTNEFKTLPSMPRERNRHAAAISQNRLWLIGGRNQATDVVHEIDVSAFSLSLYVNLCLRFSFPHFLNPVGL